MKKIFFLIVIILLLFQYGYAQKRGDSCKITKIYLNSKLKKEYFSSFKNINSIFYNTDQKKKNLLLKSDYFKFRILDASSDKEWVLIYIRYQGEKPSMYFTIKLFNVPEEKYINIFDKYINPQDPFISKDKNGEFIAFKDYSVPNYIASKKYIIDSKVYNKKIYLKNLKAKLDTFNKIDKDLEKRFF